MPSRCRPRETRRPRIGVSRNGRTQNAERADALRATQKAAEETGYGSRVAGSGKRGRHSERSRAAAEARNPWSPGRGVGVSVGTPRIPRSARNDSRRFPATHHPLPTTRDPAPISRLFCGLLRGRASGPARSASCRSATPPSLAFRERDVCFAPVTAADAGPLARTCGSRGAGGRHGGSRRSRRRTTAAPLAPGRDSRSSSDGSARTGADPAREPER